MIPQCDSFLLVMSWTILPFNSFCFQSPQKQIRNMPVLSRQVCPKQRSQKYFKKGWNIEDSLVWKAQEELPSFRNAIAFSVFVCLFCTALSRWSPVLKGDKETASLETVGGGSLPLSGHLQPTSCFISRENRKRWQVLWPLWFFVEILEQNTITWQRRRGWGGEGRAVVSCVLFWVTLKKRS